MPVTVATENAPRSLEDLRSLLKDDNKIKVAGMCYQHICIGSLELNRHLGTNQA